MSDGATNQSQPTRSVPLKYKPDGSVEALTFLTPTSFEIGARIEVPPMRIIPVVFVPGIMGSNLRKRNRPQEKVWSAPNTPLEGSGAAGSGTFTNAKERQLAFLPDEAEVDPDGPVLLHHGMPHLNERALREQRGWGTVHQGSYGQLLGYLEYQLNHVFMDRKPHWDWSALLQQQDAQRWGAQKASFEPLAEEELQRLLRARFPVYAVGYNWLQSNEKSAQYLRQRIDDILAQWPRPHHCESVLIVTHSMGGLVARRCSQLIPDKILGIVHGVMPALGAAATYKRLRAGFEGAAATVLSWNEAEATASIASAPGPLELLPQPGYNAGKPWLQLQARDAGRGGVYATQWLPRRDAYAEIYEKDAKTCWYGLVNSDLIDPAGLYNGDQWGRYIKNLGLAQSFHSDLGSHYHPRTLAYYGADPGQVAWSSACWYTPDLPRDAVPDMTQGTAPRSNGTGTIELTLGKAKVSFRLGRPDAKGDGTVPADASGHAPALSPSVQQCYRMTGFDHQFSYNDPQVRLVLLHSLAKLAQHSPLVTNPPHSSAAAVKGG